MDLRTTALELRSALDLENAEFQDGIEILDLKPLFVAPAPSSLPDDGVLQYVVITSIYELDSIEPRSCVLVADDMFASIELAVANPSIFGVRFACIRGLPGSAYTPEFDSSVWNTQSVSYNALISELNMVIQAEEATRIGSMSVYDKEREQYTRANGTVKDNTNFTLSDDSETEE